MAGLVPASYPEDLKAPQVSTFHFFYHYGKCEPDPPLSKVVEGLRRLAELMGQDISKVVAVVEEKGCLYAYTAQVFYAGELFYTFLNRLLLNDCRCALMDCVIPFIRSANSKFVNIPTPEDYNVTRGLTIDVAKIPEMLDHLTVGGKFRIASFLSTSTADGFEGNVVYKIFVPKGILNAHDITSQSAFPDEDEVLFPPWSAFEVTDVQLYDSEGRLFDDWGRIHEVKSVTIFLKAYDNMVATEIDGFDSAIIRSDDSHLLDRLLTSIDVVKCPHCGQAWVDESCCILVQCGQRMGWVEFDKTTREYRAVGPGTGPSGAGCGGEFSIVDVVHHRIKL